MSEKVLCEKSDLVAIADAVREATGSTENYNVSELSTATVEVISAGGTTGRGVLLDEDWEIGSIKSADGTETITSTNRIRTGFLIVGDIVVTCSDGVKFAANFYDADKAYLASAYVAFMTGALNIGETAPADAAFFRLVAATADDADLTDRVGEIAEQVKLYASTKKYTDRLHQMAIAYTDNMMPKMEMALFTEFEFIPGRWDLVGGIGTTGFHSQPFLVMEGRTYYFGYRGESSSCVGAFLDANGQWLQELRRTETTEYAYDNADGNGERTTYASIYAFTAPAGARYVSLNITDDAEYIYRQYLATKPVFALANTGDYIAYAGDPAYQAKKNKSLCVIGASGVTIDRLKPTGYDQYIVGFQDYLAPWYEHVGSYGFWSGSWANKNQEDNSIYNGIVGAQTDLTEYDEFLLIPSTAEVATSSDVGEITSTDTQTYMGGLNGVITYIYSQVPNAKIYLANALHKGKYFTNSTTKTLMDEINNKLAQLASLKSYQLIDLAGGTGINDWTYEAMTYDGTHLNQEGSKVQGMYIRKAIIGI